MTDTATDDILAILQSGDAEQAERACRMHLQNAPDAVEIQVLLAVSEWRLGKHDEALGVYSRLTLLHPEEPGHWCNYATTLRLTGNLAGSELASGMAVQLAPDDSGMLEMHGLLQLQLGKSSEARDTLLRAFGKSPDSPSIRIHAAQACSACRDHRADELLKPWRDWMPLDAPLQFELAEIQAQQGEVGIAVELLEDLVRRSVGDRWIRLRLACMYERVNRLAKAETLLERVAAEGDAALVGEIERQRAQLAMRRRDYATARALFDKAGPRSANDYAHWFALARACDKTGDATTALQALKFGHAHQVEELKTAVPHFFEPEAELLPRVDARVTAADYLGWPELQAPVASQSPLFVIGFPRSGTTLLEQMLDAHPRLQSMDEQPFINLLAGRLERSTG